MRFLKILVLSSTFLFTNCSLINDKFLSKSNDKGKKEHEIVKDENNKSQEEEIVAERVYIEDNEEKKDLQIKEGLRGDTEFENNA